MNPTLSFFQEIITRLQAKSPKFFIIWQWIFGIATAVVGVPELLNMLDVHVPTLVAPWLAKTVSFFTGLLWFMSKMPVANKVVAVTSDNAVIQKTEDKKLPFTVNQERKEAIKNDLISSSTLMQVTNHISKVLLIGILLLMFSLK